MGTGAGLGSQGGKPRGGGGECDIQDKRCFIPKFVLMLSKHHLSVCLCLSGYGGNGYGTQPGTCLFCYLVFVCIEHTIFKILKSVSSTLCLLDLIIVKLNL